MDRLEQAVLTQKSNLESLLSPSSYVEPEHRTDYKNWVERIARRSGPNQELAVGVVKTCQNRPDVG